jgi:hypothetical protein
MADTDHATPGEPPPVRDEAADSPMWLPILGACLLLLGTIAIVWRARTAEEPPPPAEEAAAEEAAAADGAPAEGEAPAADPAQPAAPQPAH